MPLFLELSLEIGCGDGAARICEQAALLSNQAFLNLFLLK
jgi:hypothetical protein